MSTPTPDPFAGITQAMRALDATFGKIADAMRTAGDKIARAFRVPNRTLMLAQARMKAGGNDAVLGDQWVCASCMGWLCDTCAGLGCSCTGRTHR